MCQFEEKREKKPTVEKIQIPELAKIKGRLEELIQGKKLSGDLTEDVDDPHLPKIIFQPQSGEIKREDILEILREVQENNLLSCFQMTTITIPPSAKFIGKPPQKMDASVQNVEANAIALGVWKPPSDSTQKTKCPSCGHEF